MDRRTFLCAASALAATGFTRAAAASVAPASGDLSLIVPFPPGGGGDILARAVTSEMAAVTGTRWIVMNRPGAGGNIGAAHVAKAAPSAETIGYVTNGILCVNPHLYPTARFDPQRDLIPVAGLTEIGLVAVVNPAVMPEATDFERFIALAANSNEPLTFASAGNGTSSHLAGILFSSQAGIPLRHIPHPGGAIAVKEVLAGRVSLMIDVMPNVLPHIRRGALKALAVTSLDRSPLLPEVPTMAEAGLARVCLTAWDGLAAPVGFPEAGVRAIEVAARRALAMPRLEERLARLGAHARFRDASAFADFIALEAPKWKTLALKARAARS